MRGSIILLGKKNYLLKLLLIFIYSIDYHDVFSVDLNSLDFKLDSQNFMSGVVTSKKNSVVDVKDKKGEELGGVLTRMESEFSLPRGLLEAISKIESNFNPNAINAGGRGHYFNTAEEAADFVNECIDKGKKNISIGCLQLLYAAHNQAFERSALNMLNPERNARYAAQYLKSLYKRYGTWEMAVKRYHSPNPRSGELYVKKILKTGYLKESL